MCVDTRIDFPRVTDSLLPWAQSNDFGHSSYRKFFGVRGWRAMFRITLHVIQDERNQMRRWRRDPSEGAISIAPVSKRSEKGQERDVLDPGEIAGEIMDPSRDLEIRQILDQLPPIARRVLDLILDEYSPTAAAQAMQREKQWGRIYPAKVLQILKDLWRECQRSA